MAIILVRIGRSFPNGDNAHEGVLFFQIVDFNLGISNVNLGIINNNFLIISFNQGNININLGILKFKVGISKFNVDNSKFNVHISNIKVDNLEKKDGSNTLSYFWSFQVQIFVWHDYLKTRGL